jgi:hypothetical protein
MEQVETAMAKAGEIPRRAGKITYLERALILCLEGKRTTRDEDLAQVFDEKAAQIQRTIAGVMAPPPAP